MNREGLQTIRSIIKAKRAEILDTDSLHAQMERISDRLKIRQSVLMEVLKGRRYRETGPDALSRSKIREIFRSRLGR